MRKVLLSGAAALAFGCAPALAEDWSGPYAGFSLGVSVADSEWQATQSYDPGGFAIPFLSDPSSGLSNLGGKIGLFAGYNWQLGEAWVVGAEGDIFYASNSDRANRIPGLWDNDSDDLKSSVSATADLGASLRARAGYLVTPDVLLFATGGLALQRVETKTVCPADTEVCNPFFGTQEKSDSELWLGWTLGAGAEYALNRYWHFRLEYRYADYGSDSFGALTPISNVRFGSDAELDLATHSITFGVSYSF